MHPVYLKEGSQVQTPGVPCCLHGPQANAGEHDHSKLPRVTSVFGCTPRAHATARFRLTQEGFKGGVLCGNT